MPIDIDTLESPGWWLNYLAGRLQDRRHGFSSGRRWRRDGVASSKSRPPLELLNDYLRGDPPLREDIHTQWAAEFRQFLRMGRLNAAPLLVNPTVNRMGLRGFRTAAANDDLGDVEAGRIMRRNHLAKVSREVHRFQKGLGTGYILVTPPDDRRAWSLMTSESPLHCITEVDPATGETLAGLKMFRDEIAGADMAYLYLPGELWVARLDGRASTLDRRTRFSMSRKWEWDEARFDDIPDDRVPLYAAENPDGVGEIEANLDTLDRINDNLFNAWWAAKIQGFRQRAIHLPDEEVEETEDGEMDDVTEPQTDLAGMFTSAPDALWTLPENAKIWESTPIDIRPLRDLVREDLKDMASTNAIPLTTVTPDAATGSAEGAQLMREEHVYKIGTSKDYAAPAWQNAMATAFAFQGDGERAQADEIEVLWAPSERYSLAERSDGASKLKDILPWETLMTDVLQYAPDQVDQIRNLRARDLLFADVPAAGAAQ